MKFDWLWRLHNSFKLCCHKSHTFGLWCWRGMVYEHRCWKHYKELLKREYPNRGL